MTGVQLAKHRDARQRTGLLTTVVDDLEATRKRKAETDISPRPAKVAKKVDEDAVPDLAPTASPPQTAAGDLEEEQQEILEESEYDPLT